MIIDCIKAAGIVPSNKIFHGLPTSNYVFGISPAIYNELFELTDEAIFISDLLEVDQTNTTFWAKYDDVAGLRIAHILYGFKHDTFLVALRRDSKKCIRYCYENAAPLPEKIYTDLYKNATYVQLRQDNA